jgi:hypothetical protein
MTRANLIEHYESKGFRMFDATESWALMRKGVFEAFIRPSDAMRVTWEATVVQLEPCPIGDCAEQGKQGAEHCYRSVCGQINDGIACDLLRAGSERYCPDCNPRA